MNRLQELLRSFGLSETEQDLYLTGLESSEVNVSYLVNKTGVNRTTAYHALSTLKTKGFCHESKKSGKLVYIMTRPEFLLQMLTRRQAALETQKHELAELLDRFPEQKSGGDNVLVEKFEGQNGVKSAVDKALYCKERKWRIIAPKSNIFSQMPEAYANYFMRTRREREIQAKTLWEFPEDPRSRSFSFQELLMRRPRYLAPSMSGRFRATIIQFDDKVLLLNSLSHESAALITSSEIADTFGVMFDGLWDVSAKPL